MADPFEEHLDSWRAWCEAPWGRIRFAVVAHTLRRHVAELAPHGAGLRVLDVGGGDARDSLPLALAGHDVTVVDTAARMLAEARLRAQTAGVALHTIEASLDDLAGVGEDYDLVLCHFVLHYREPGQADVRRLADRLRPGGLLSLVAPNPAGRVLPSLVRDGPGAALAALEQSRAGVWSSTTFAHAGRTLAAEEAGADLAAAGLEQVARYGGRIANDLIIDDGLKHDPATYADLERLELALCDSEPLLRTGMFWQLLARARAVPS